MRYIILCILLILPIIDYSNNISDTSPLALYFRILLLILMSSYVVFDIIKNDIKLKNVINTSLFSIIFYLWINTFWHTGEVLPIDIVKVFLPFVAYFFFYKFFFGGNLGLDTWGYFSQIFIPVVFLLILLFLSTRATIRTEGIVAYSDNNGYVMLYALPMLLFVKNKRLFLVFLTVLIFGVILTGKRGAILGLLLAILFSWKFFMSLYVAMSIRDKHIVTVALFIVILCVSTLFHEELSQMFQRMVNSLSTGGSGRDLLYKEYLQSIVDSNYLELIFGHGIYSGLSNLSLGQMAHQDWLQILYDLGLLGIVVYISFYVALIIEIRNSRCYSNTLYYALIQIFVIHFVKGLVSCTFLMPTTLIYLYGILGSIIGEIDKNRIKCINC